jgi:hypothetical protein
VDEVEFVLLEGPFQLSVVKLELAVRGRPFGLDGGKIGTDDEGGRELVCEIAVVVG